MQILCFSSEIVWLFLKRQNFLGAVLQIRIRISWDMKLFTHQDPDP